MKWLEAERHPQSVASTSTYPYRSFWAGSCMSVFGLAAVKDWLLLAGGVPWKPQLNYYTAGEN
jgi:hypothetical protein